MAPTVFAATSTTEGKPRREEDKLGKLNQHGQQEPEGTPPPEPRAEDPGDQDAQRQMASPFSGPLFAGSSAGT